MSNLWYYTMRDFSFRFKFQVFSYGLKQVIWSLWISVEYFHGTQTSKQNLECDIASCIYKCLRVGLLLNCRSCSDNILRTGTSGFLHVIWQLYFQLARGVVLSLWHELSADDVRCEFILLPLHCSLSCTTGRIHSFHQFHGWGMSYHHLNNNYCFLGY